MDHFNASKQLSDIFNVGVKFIFKIWTKSGDEKLKMFNENTWIIIIQDNKNWIYDIK